MKSLILLLITFGFIWTSGINAAVAERTLAIIKPDAVAANHIGDIISRYEKAGLSIAELHMVRLNEEKAKQFYAIHANKPFFADLVKLMTSGPCVVIVLEGEDAIQRNRKLIGSLEEKGSLRGDFGTSKTNNAVHGSDSPENAAQEINYFFSK